ncbi:MAG TPA: hypothetical protein VGC41_27310 [Kofleriaceae bacterium]
MRVVLLLLGLCAYAHASPAIRCDEMSNAELSVDGLLDDWKGQSVLARIGVPTDGAIELKCSWDGTTLGLALDLADDRVVRVRGKGHEDRVDISISVTGGKPIAIVVYPGNAIAKEKILAPPKVEAADSLQPKGFSIEAKIPANRIPGFSASSPSFELRVNFHDADQAAGGDDSDLVLAKTIELGDKKDLLDDFLRTSHLKRADVKLDVMADLDPDRKGKERLVAGGSVIGVLTDQFGYVTVPGEMREVKLVPLGPGAQQVVEALVRQSGNGGTRDLLMLWTVWSGQMSPLAQIEVRKQMGNNVLECEWKIVNRELLVTPKPAIGWTAATWNEQSAEDADSIVAPWDETGGIGYKLRGHEVARRDLAKKRR